MSTWDGRSRGRVWGYSFFVGLVRVVPLQIAYILLEFVAVFYLLAEHRGRRQVYKLYKQRLGFSVIKSSWHTFRNFSVFARVLLDKLAMLSDAGKGYTFDFDGRTNIVSLTQSGCGGMLVGAHIGAWEMATYELKPFDKDLHVVLLDNEHTALKQFLGKVSKQDPYKTIPIRADLSHIFKIHSVVQARGLLCMHGDRFVEDSPVLKRLFLGKEAFFPAGPFELASRLGLPVCFVFAFKTGIRHYSLSATEVFSPNLGAKALLDAYVTTLEQKVRKYPQQWFNYYDFWQPAPTTVDA